MRSAGDNASMPDVAPPYTVRCVPRIADLDARQWDALAAASRGAATPQPFLAHAFLDGIERTGCVGPGTGWTVTHLVLEDANGTLAAATPLYLKWHSYGEYVFDWAWADAYQRHGLDYYPKLLCAIPFTPVAGVRLLGRDTAARQALARALVEHAKESAATTHRPRRPRRGAPPLVSSLHVLFPSDEEAGWLHQAGMMLRRGVQFHWHNAGYRDFADFLAALSQAKRKKIRAERRKVAEAGVTVTRRSGREIGAGDWAFFARCYEATYEAHYSTPYLNREFFQWIGERLGDRLTLVVAERESRPIACSLLVRDDDRLYGRHWGTVEPVPFVHFEVCYYQAIEEAIASKLAIVEGGAQGEHKMARGFEPTPTQSCHWLAQPEFAQAVDSFLAREGRAIDGYLDELKERSPFRDATGEAVPAGAPSEPPPNAR